MIAERPVDTVERWISQDWIVNGVSLEELTTKLHCISNETNRTPDSNHYLFKDGQLIDPYTGDPILRHIAKGVEYEVAQALQDRVATSDEGIFVWNSPKLDNIYPCNKTMIYQIAYNANLEKVLLYSAILYDGTIENSEEHRKTLIAAPDNDNTFFGVLSWIEKVSKQKQKVSAGASRVTAQYFAERINSGVDPHIVLEEMKQTGFIGQHSISCPGAGQSFSNFTSAGANILVFAGSKDKYGELTFECTKGHVNIRPYGKFLKYCKTCGEDVSCGNAEAVAA